MMQTLRKAAAAVMFAILIVAFAVSMGGNNYFDRYTHSSVAKVGSVEITPQAYQRAYQQALENLSARAKQRITSQQAQAFGLPDRVLQGLIQDAAIDSEAQKLGLGLSKGGLGSAIKGVSYFQDTQGKFSPAKYQRFLQQAGYSEIGFEHEFQQDLIRRQIQSVFRTSGVVPAAMLEAFNRYTNETREIGYFVLDEAAAGPVEQPSEEALKAFYDQRKRQFYAPEFRKVFVTSISPQALAKSMTIPDEELKARYDANAAAYALPERRTIEMISFKSQKAAEDAAAQLKAKKSFADVAKEAGFKDGPLTFGPVSKKELSEKIAANDAILKTAFELKRDAISQPLNGPLSWVILRVTGIVAGKDKSFDEVKDQIREDIANGRAQAEAAKLTKAFEEERTAGVSIQDAAKKLGLPSDEVTIAQNGTGEDGKAVSVSTVPAVTLAEAAFKSDAGVENDALRLPGGGYSWFDVQDVIKPRQKPFEEVKAEVEAAWRLDQSRTKLTAKAKELIDRINKGEPLADAAKSVKAEVKTTPAIKRNAQDADVPASVISQAFSLSTGTAASAAMGDGTSRAIFEVEKITPPGPLNALEAKTLSGQLSEQIAEDNFAAYLTGLQKSIGITVDRKTLAAAAGGSYDE
jgi:peptidyl-prolyl cis-trans isomerase D